MSVWKKLFGPSQASLEDFREPRCEGERERVSCLDIVRSINSRIAGFLHRQGMVVVIQRGCLVQIYFFDGHSHMSWKYNEQGFSTDEIGQRYLTQPTMEFVLSRNTEHLLLGVLQREFGQYEVNTGNLWQLNPKAWDYELRLKMNLQEIWVRISLDRIPT